MYGALEFILQCPFHPTDRGGRLFPDLQETHRQTQGIRIEVACLSTIAPIFLQTILEDRENRLVL